MRANASSRLLGAGCLIAACAGILAVAFIFVFLIGGAIPAISKIGLISFLSGTIWQPSSGHYGILPMICGTLAVTGLAALIGFPLGLACAVFLAFDCPKILYPLARAAVLLMAGIPSVVYGFFGLTVLVPWIRDTFGGQGLSLLAASLLLGFMILPTIASISLTSIQAVPAEIYQGSRALGSSHERSIFKAVLPAARRGIGASLVLGLGRAAGETMAVMMVAGNQPILPDSLLNGVRTLTANIAMEMGYAADLHREALIACGAVLLIMIFLVSILPELIAHRKERTSA